MTLEEKEAAVLEAAVEWYQNQRRRRREPLAEAFERWKVVKEKLIKAVEEYLE